MRDLTIRTLFLVPLLAMASPLPAHGPAQPTARRATLSPAARGAAAIVDRFHAALRRGNSSAAAALLAGDALIFESGGAERTKAEYLEHHLPADSAFSQAVPSTVTRRAGNAGTTLAWIASEGRTTGTYTGKAVDQLTTETMILRRTGKEWKIVHIHWSSAAKR